jgi:hypothetical protein
MKTLISNIIDEEILPQKIENETNFEFIQRICALCLDELEGRKAYSPIGFGEDVIDEIEQEVTEVFKIKTYGYYNLSAYRQAVLKKRIS